MLELATRLCRQPGFGYGINPIVSALPGSGSAWVKLKGRAGWIAIVAMARKLLIALWRLTETGELLVGAVLNVGRPGEQLIDVALPDGVPSQVRQLNNEKV